MSSLLSHLHTTLILLRFFLIHAAYIMILAVVSKAKQNGNVYGSPMPYGQIPEFTAIDSAVQAIELSAHRHTWARRYLIQIKELQRQLISPHSNGSTPSSMPSTSSPISSSVVAADFDRTMEKNTSFQNLVISNESASTYTAGSSGPFGQSSTGPMTMDLDAWQFEQFLPGTDDSLYSKLGINSEDL